MDPKIPLIARYGGIRRGYKHVHSLSVDVVALRLSEG